jgi:NADH-quinone oxidoreductase subunit A
MREEYSYLLIHIILSMIISTLVIGLSCVIVMRKRETEKLSAYECGFHPFEDARSKFDVKFYLVAILFIIFDLEIMLMLPWSVKVWNLGLVGFYGITGFISILMLGLIYEWKSGALEW